MKKLFIFAIMVVALMAVPFTAMADSATFVVDVTSYSATGSIDYYSGQNAGAFGMAGGIGAGTSTGFGEITEGNGTVWGDATANGSGSYSLDVGPSAGGVFSGSFAGAETGATFDVGTDIVDGFGTGTADGFIGGFAAQGTLNSTYVTKSQGFSGGIAGQGSAGGFVGGVATVASGVDGEGTGYSGGEAGGPGYYAKYKNPKSPQVGRAQYFPNGHPVGNSEWKFLGQNMAGGNDVFATADTGAGITMSGGSYSKTEGMGTTVGAWTKVDSFGYNNDYRSGDEASMIAVSNVNGGWVAKGGVATLTVQTTNNGGASAFAAGSYSGAGSLGLNYTGSAVGYSETAAQSNGIMGAGAGMTVTSTINRTTQ
jgi:hypothetical protein